MTHFKTIETTTEPAFILTNNVLGSSSDGIIMLIHWYTGDEDEVTPTPSLEMAGVVPIDCNAIKKLIAALEEFL